MLKNAEFEQQPSERCYSLCDSPAFSQNMKLDSTIAQRSQARNDPADQQDSLYDTQIDENISSAAA